MSENPNPKEKGNEENNPQEPKNEDKTPETFSRDDLEKMLAEKLAVMKAEAKKEQEQAEELAKLNGAEKIERELEIEREELEKDRLKFQREKTELEVTKQLAERGLPIAFAKMLISDTAEQTFENVDILEKEWQTYLEKAVREKLKGSPIEGGNSKQQEDTAGNIGKRLAEQKTQNRYSEENNPYF